MCVSNRHALQYNIEINVILQRQTKRRNGKKRRKILNQPSGNERIIGSIYFYNISATWIIVEIKGRIEIITWLHTIADIHALSLQSLTPTFYYVKVKKMFFPIHLYGNILQHTITIFYLLVFFTTKIRQIYLKKSIFGKEPDETEFQALSVMDLKWKYLFKGWSTWSSAALRPVYSFYSGNVGHVASEVHLYKNVRNRAPKRLNVLWLESQYSRLVRLFNNTHAQWLRTDFTSRITRIQTPVWTKSL